MTDYVGKAIRLQKEYFHKLKTELNRWELVESREVPQIDSVKNGRVIGNISFRVFKCVSCGEVSERNFAETVEGRVLDDKSSGIRCPVLVKEYAGSST